MRKGLLGHVRDCQPRNASRRHFNADAFHDCLDHLIILDDRHLRRLLRDYAEYYNRLRTHLSLNKDVPLGRPVQSHVVLRQLPHFGGLHHSFVRL
jgi:hypothetical protein